MRKRKGRRKNKRARPEPDHCVGAETSLSPVGYWIRWVLKFLLYGLIPVFVSLYFIPGTFLYNLHYRPNIKLFPITLTTQERSSQRPLTLDFSLFIENNSSRPHTIVFDSLIYGTTTKAIVPTDSTRNQRLGAYDQRLVTLNSHQTSLSDWFLVPPDSNSLRFGLSYHVAGYGNSEVLDLKSERIDKCSYFMFGHFADIPQKYRARTLLLTSDLTIYYTDTTGTKGDTTVQLPGIWSNEWTLEHLAIEPNMDSVMVGKLVLLDSDVFQGRIAGVFLALEDGGIGVTHVGASSFFAQLPDNRLRNLLIEEPGDSSSRTEQFIVCDFKNASPTSQVQQFQRNRAYFNFLVHETNGSMRSLVHDLDSAGFRSVSLQTGFREFLKPNLFDNLSSECESSIDACIHDYDATIRRVVAEDGIVIFHPEDDDEQSLAVLEGILRQAFAPRSLNLISVPCNCGHLVTRPTLAPFAKIRIIGFNFSQESRRVARHW